MGDVFTVADGYLFTVLVWMPLFAIDLGHWPGITDYKQRIAAQPREAKIPIVA